jgi:hypothetical protein
MAGEPIQQSKMDQVPDPCFLPVTQAPPTGHAGTTSQLLGQHLPRDATLKDKHNAVQAGSVGQTRPTSSRLGLWFWQKGLNQVPQAIGNQCDAHKKCTSGKMRVCALQLTRSLVFILIRWNFWKTKEAQLHKSA